MTIIHMGWHDNKEFRDGAYSPVEWKDGAPVKSSYHLYSTHQGLCLFEREANSYHDSDFYMTVWNSDEQKPEEILFASTRGWTYPCYASAVDATEEVRAAYNAWRISQEEIRRRQARSTKACKLWAFRASMKAAASAHNFPHWRLLRLERIIGGDQLDRLMTLFSTRIRSQFKLKLRQQVVEWLQQDTPKYPTPLSKKQMQYV